VSWVQLRRRIQVKIKSEERAPSVLFLFERLHPWHERRNGLRDMERRRFRSFECCREQAASIPSRPMNSFDFFFPFHFFRHFPQGFQRCHSLYSNLTHWPDSMERRLRIFFMTNRKFKTSYVVNSLPSRNFRLLQEAGSRFERPTCT